MNDEIVELRITEADVRAHSDPQLLRELSALEQAPKLGLLPDDTKERLMEILPQIIASKISRILPKGFEIAEIAFAIKFKGNFAVLGIDGDVGIKIKPRREN